MDSKQYGVEELEKILSLAQDFRTGKNDEQAVKYLAGLLINAGWRKPSPADGKSMHPDTTDWNKGAKLAVEHLNADAKGGLDRELISAKFWIARRGDSAPESEKVMLMEECYRDADIVCGTFGTAPSKDVERNGFNEEKRCCSVCDAKKKCHICGQQTLLACSDCRINFGVTVYVCSNSKCRDTHESKCLGPNFSPPQARVVPTAKEIVEKLVEVRKEFDNKKDWWRWEGETEYLTRQAVGIMELLKGEK